MKNLFPLLALLVLPASAALAQTVLPSGAVAPTSGTINAANVPGSQPEEPTPRMSDGGSPRGRRRDDKIPGLNHKERHELRKLAKEKEVPH